MIVECLPAAFRGFICLCEEGVAFNLSVQVKTLEFLLNPDQFLEK